MAAEDSLGTRIAKRRHQLDLSQEDLAGLVGVSRDSVSKWETDKNRPLRHLGKLEAVLGISLSDGAPDPNEQEIRELGARLGLTAAAQDSWVEIYRKNHPRQAANGTRRLTG